MPDLIPLRIQAKFGPTDEWADEARALLRWLEDRRALLRPVGEVVDHAAVEGVE